MDFLQEIRALFHGELEKLKSAKLVGRSEEVFAEIHWPALFVDTESLREVLKCARVQIIEGEKKITLTLAWYNDWFQCPRCRRFFDALYDESGHGMVCERCDWVMHMRDFDSGIATKVTA